MSKQATTCPNCKTETYTRNNYFTGKLMVERDFTDEQHYFMEKLRLHNQRLHGSGIVCGLQVVQHDNPACRDRYVILQPGTAIDCCGKDILVTEPEVIDLYAFPELQALLEQNANPDNNDDNGGPHTLQLRICYRECPTEDIPVLYDECGCDDTQCAPNRILESYRIELAIDPQIAADNLLQPSLDWAATINIAHAWQAALHEATERLYVLTAGDQATLYQVSTDNLAIETSFALNRQALALAVAPDGAQLYVLVAHQDGPEQGNAELWVFDTSGGSTLSSGPDRGAEVPASADSKASLSTVPDGRLVAIFNQAGKVRVWAAGVPDPASIPNAQKANIGVDLRNLAVAADGIGVYLAEPGTGNLHQIDIDTNGLDPRVLTLAGINASALAAIHSTGPERLAVIDHANQALHIVDPSGAGSVVASAALQHAPREVVISAGGHWAWVLEHEGGDSYVQSVNLRALLQGEPGPTGVALEVGSDAQQLLLTASGRRLFVPYPDDLSIDDAGGVAILDITEQACGELLCGIQDCPDCETSDCLVLATIENYNLGDHLTDQADPAPDPSTDNDANIARINNALHRKLLPSTQALTAAIKCILDNCCDGAAGGGEQGPPGPPGPPGPQGPQGPAGPGLDPDLPHICVISWEHAGQLSPGQLVEQGLVIGFDTQVRNSDLHRMSIRLLVEHFENDNQLTCWCEPDIELSGVIFEQRCNLEFGFGTENDPNAEVNGVQILLSNRGIIQRGMRVRVLINGDFIRGRHLATGEFRGGDFNHLPPWLPNTRTGDGVEGGTFESWFTIEQG